MWVGNYGIINNDKCTTILISNFSKFSNLKFWLISRLFPSKNKIGPCLNHRIPIPTTDHPIHLATLRKTSAMHHKAMHFVWCIRFATPRPRDQFLDPLLLFLKYRWSLRVFALRNMRFVFLGFRQWNFSFFFFSKVINEQRIFILSRLC